MNKKVYILHHTFKGQFYFDGVFDNLDFCINKRKELVLIEEKNTSKAKRRYGITDTQFYKKENRK